MLKSKTADSWNINFVRVLIGTTILRLVFAATAGLKGEEAYYWDCGKHAALSYFDIPPLTGWLVRLSTEFGKHMEMWVRVPAVILFVITLMFLFRTAKLMFGNRAAFLAVAVACLLPALEWHSMMMFPEALLLCFWSIGLYCGYKLISDENTYWWWGIGASLGLGLLSQYPAALIPLAPVLFALITKKRNLFDKHFWLSLGLAILMFSPVIFWNYQNDWASFKNLASSFINTNSAANNLQKSLIYQLLALTPGGLVLFVWLLARGLKMRSDDKYLYLLCSALPLWLLFICASFVQETSISWLVTGYLAPAIMAGAWMESTQAWKTKKIILALIFVPGLALSFLPIVNALAPIPALNKFDEFHGWDQVAREVLLTQREMPNPNLTFYAGNGCKMAAELAFYTNCPYLTLSDNILGEQAKSFSYWENPKLFAGWDCIYVLSEDLASDDNWVPSNAFSQTSLEQHFQEVEHESRLTAFQGGKPLRRFKIFKCHNYLGPEKIKPKP